jgi:hypothetical protein
MKRNLIALFGVLALVAPLSAQIISPGKTLSWSTNTGQMGSLRIGSVSGQYFEAEQTNEKNRAAGVVKLYGALLDDGRKVVLINAGQWKEVWEGSIFEHEITGNLVTGSSRFSFRIVEPSRHSFEEHSRHPFLEGRTMKWTSGAGQSGLMRVVSSSGSRFVLEQKNDRNPAAGLTIFEGEVIDGRVILINKQWNETWEGSLRDGRVTGKINHRIEFSIFE